MVVVGGGRSGGAGKVKVKAAPSSSRKASNANEGKRKFGPGTGTTVKGKPGSSSGSGGGIKGRSKSSEGKKGEIKGIVGKGSKSRSSSPSTWSTSTGRSCTNSTASGNSSAKSIKGVKSPQGERMGAPPECNGGPNGNGPKIQAQRKFAQAGNIYLGTLNLNQAIPSHSPYATPSKELTPFKRSQDGSNGSAKKVKKPMFSPPPCKRPKTEDFLTFLCARGTPSLPPELDFFSHAQLFEHPASTSETQLTFKKKSVVQSLNQCSASVGTDEIQESITTASSKSDVSRSRNSLKLKHETQGKKCVDIKKILMSSSTNSVSSTTSSACIAENPTKGIRATASSVLFSKLRKTSPVTKTRPIISPPRSRINEQDARFAMTALKLKYQRLAVTKNRSAILTKKAKESIILTRSKARVPFSTGKLSPKKSKVLPRSIKPVVVSPSRNAPSPDIIFGVTSCVSAARKRAITTVSSEDESNSEGESDSDRSGESSEEDLSGSENDSPKKSAESAKGSRKGKDRNDLTTGKKSVKQDTKTSDKRRVGTRSAHRLTKSPLREIPMYKPKIPKKGKRTDKKDKKTHRQTADKKDNKKLTSKNKVDRNDTGKRPQRKTKETAANLLGLLTKGFSTDEETQGQNEEESDVGSSSSSETNYLEKHYNAALKREEEKFLNKKGNSGRASEAQKRSTRSSSNVSKKSDKTMAARKLRSKSGSSEVIITGEKVKSKDKNQITGRSRTRHGTPTVGDRKMPGAARKSAAIVCKGNLAGQHSSSEEENQSSADESDNETERNEKPRRRTKDHMKKKLVDRKGPNKKKGKIIPPKLGKIVATSTDDDSDGQSGSEEDEGASKGKESQKVFSRRKAASRKENASKQFKSTRKREQNAKSSSEESDQDKTNESELDKDITRSSPEPLEAQSSSTDDNDKSSESSDEDEGPPPIKVDMSTQVDMDEEEGIVTPSMCLTDGTERIIKPTSSCSIKKDLVLSDSDDEVQEIGQVFASSSAAPRIMHSRSKLNKSSPEHSARTQGTCSAATHATSSHFQYQTMPQAQPTFPPQPTLDPLHNNPFNPFMPPPQAPTRPLMQQDFYTPLQLSPLVHSSIQLVGSSFPVSNPLNTLSIPVSVPFSSHLLPHHPSLTSAAIGFAGHSTFHSTTQQTYVRSVATNLDIPLVRPMVGTEQHSTFMSARTTSVPLTRPPSVGVNGVWGHASLDPSRNPYSAFRMPHHVGTAQHTTQHVIHHQSTTVLGMNSTPVLPVSIIQPQMHHHHQHSQSVQHSSGSNYHQDRGHSSTSKHRNLEEKVNHVSAGVSSAGHRATASSTHKEQKAATPPGYHLIKHLPNVSIVPKFDRSAVPTQEPGSSKKGTSKSGADGEVKEKKKVGRKPKGSVVLPAPTSPLTVRKDSNPATYAPRKIKTEDSDSIMTNATVQEEPEPSASSHCLSNTVANTSSSIPDAPKKSKKKGTGTSKEGSSSSSGLPPKSTRESPKPVKEKKAKDNVNLSKAQPQSSSSARASSPGQSSKMSKNNKGSDEVIKITRNGIADAPTFHPSEQDFEDPLKYIQKIQSHAEKYGMARIVPPKSFRPECNVEDDMRFTAYNHYIHKMYQRWGPNVLETEAIKQNLKQNQVDVSEVPAIGGMEINLSTLYQTVKSFGGLTEVMDKQRWTKVADALHVPKAAHDRASKLDGISLKFVLPYETLSDSEREKLKKKVEKKWTKRKDKVLKAIEMATDDDLEEDSMDELDDCIVKGKTTPLGSYFRVARNTMQTFFPPEAKKYTTDEIEEEYWKIVREKSRHVCVYSGSIDCAGVGWGFPNPKASNKHPWNLKVLANNQGSVLRSMGPVMGATVPTLHVAMLFTSYCWYRDPHCLPWLEYLHSGAKKIWYSVPASHENVFRAALSELMPMQCKKKKIWLPSDSAMVPPELLIAKGVPLVRAVQNPGEFLVVFPKAFTSAVCTGYLISESVCFAYPSWLRSCVQTFKDIQESKEPPVFPLEKLLLSILQDARASLDVVRMVIPAAKDLINEELSLRKKLNSVGLKYGGKITSDTSEKPGSSKGSNRKNVSREEEIEQCHICNYTLYLSMVRNSKTDASLCLKHAADYFVSRKPEIKKSSLLFDFDEKQLLSIVENASKRCGSTK